MHLCFEPWIHEIDPIIPIGQIKTLRFRIGNSLANKKVAGWDGELRTVRLPTLPPPSAPLPCRLQVPLAAIAVYLSVPRLPGKTHTSPPPTRFTLPAVALSQRHHRIQSQKRFLSIYCVLSTMLRIRAQIMNAKVTRL